METPRRGAGGTQAGDESPFSGIADDHSAPPPFAGPERGDWLGQWHARSMLVTFVSVVALVLIGLGVFWFQKGSRKVTLNNAVVQGATIPVNVAVEGKVLSFAVAEGDYVKVGAVIAQLQNSDHKSKLNEAQEQARKAEAQKIKAEKGLEDLKKRVPVEMSQATKAVETSRAKLKAAEVRMRGDSAKPDQAHVVYKAGPEYVRQKQEREVSRKVAKEEVLAARKELQRNEERLRTAKAKHNLMETKLRSLATAKARLERVQSSLDKAKDYLAATTISTPISGIVSRRVVGEGDPVKSGDTVALLVDLNRLWLEASVTEADLKTISIGQTVHVRFDAYPNSISKGTIVAIGTQTSKEAGPPAQTGAPAGDSRSPVEVPLKVELSRVDQQLKPGMRASIIIDPEKS